jgi:hypothetical protein
VLVEREEKLSMILYNGIKVKRLRVKLKYYPVG